MLDSNTNKVTWVGVAMGIVALLGVGATQLYPEAMETAKSHIIKVTGGGAASDGKAGGKSGDTPAPVAEPKVREGVDDYAKSKLEYTFDAATKTASVSGFKTNATDKNLVVLSAVSKDGVEYAVTKIDANAFKGASLDSVTIPGSVKTIGNSAFATAGLKTITMAEGVETIGASAFQHYQA